jgi:hypothetical protein
MRRLALGDIMDFMHGRMLYEELIPIINNSIILPCIKFQYRNINFKLQAFKNFQTFYGTRNFTIMWDVYSGRT